MCVVAPSEAGPSATAAEEVIVGIAARMPSTEQLASPLHQELFEDAKYRQQRHDERDILARLALQAHIKQKTAVLARDECSIFILSAVSSY